VLEKDENASFHYLRYAKEDLEAALKAFTPQGE
jgi:hypothetical protein